MRLALVLVAALSLTGCGSLGAMVRTTLDVARCLCRVAAEEQPQELLGGLTAEQWCDVSENVQPFVEEVTAAKVAATRRAGLAVPIDRRK